MHGFSSFISHLSSLKRKRRFTLIELLVVIAMIAILAAMLLPALNKARQTSLRVGCMGKMKDLNMQDRQYADMYKDFGFPYNVKLLYNGEVLGGKDHSTIVSYLRKVEKDQKTHSKLRNPVDDIIKNIKGR